MNSRNTRPAPRAQNALVHRGPQALNLQQAGVATPVHAPNAALLIDFDNVTMGIRSELQKELHTLLSSDIIKGKVAVRRAYADWRRYPQYIVPLTESSIDLIFAPAYGSSKKNATDIRLAIDALELVFTRPEIGTFVLLSGDSDFSSMVIKLKEYGKYVIGIGIRESSSDLLVQNCDEYYSYNALAGLMKANDENEPQKKWDPWELVTESVGRMKKNGDVMRSDRLKQVMQEIDASFDEKDLGMSKFSRFVQEAQNKGLVSVNKLENGQLEIDLPAGAAPIVASPQRPETPAAAESRDREEEGGRPRRGRRGRGRGRGGEDRGPREPQRTEATAGEHPQPATASPQPATRNPQPEDGIGVSGERLTRQEAFDLVRRTVATMATDDTAVRASAVRAKARELLGRDSESLSDRMFVRVLKDAHDNGIIDLRRRGDDFEVARAAEAESVADQLAKAAAAHAPAPSAPAAPAPRVGMGPRGAGGRLRGRLGAPPADLLSIGVVSTPSAPVADEAEAEVHVPAAKGRKPAAKKKSAKAVPVADNGQQDEAAPPVAKKGRAPAKTRAKKAGARSAT
jgi:uncharacterized protein (TIGR00288 family)